MPRVIPKNPYKARDEAYLAARSIPEPNSGCWLWLGPLNSDGYVQLGLFPYTKAHQLACFLKHGERPEGTEVDHICRVRSCVNPDHMRYLTHSENMAETKGLHQKSHCVNGHPLSGDNLVIRKRYNGTSQTRRHCRACERAKWQRRNSKQKAPK